MDLYLPGIRKLVEHMSKLPATAVPATASSLPAGSRQPVEHSAVSQNYYFDVGPTAYPNRYYLELIDGPSVSNRLDAIECPYVNSVRASFPSAVERTWTIESLYEEHRGFRQREFTLTGRSGFTELQLVRFHKFRNFIEKYQELSALNKNAFVRARDIRLVLNFPFEGESFYATATSFEYARDPNDSRLSFKWTLKLVTYGFATRKWSVPAAFQQFLDRPGDNTDHTGIGHRCHRYAIEAIAKAPPGESNLFPGNDDVMDAVDGVRPGALPKPTTDLSGSGLGPPSDDADRLRDLWYSTLDAIALTYGLWNNLSPFLRARSRLRVTAVLRWYNELHQQAAIGLGLRYESIVASAEAYLVSRPGTLDLIGQGNAGPLGFMFSLNASAHRPPSHQPKRPKPPRALPFSPAPVISATVSGGDLSLADVAQRMLGDRHMWPAIAQLNGWTNARYDKWGRPITPGMTLLVPAPAGTPSPGADDLYGTGLAIVDGDLVMVGTTDIGLVRGEANLRQNLNHRMLTERGTNTTFPQFGLAHRVGDSASSDVAGSLMADIKTQVLADHRVSRITKLRVIEDGRSTTLRAEFEAEAITRARTKTSFTMPWVV